MARYFAHDGKQTLNITTIDKDDAYHLFLETQKRLSQWNVNFIKGDSLELYQKIFLHLKALNLKWL